ncbi:hypothetical protein L596_003116 [Steinernema carpocapsae]|uniref:Uncharacterized protein n=1 Tax=Steinernema carpocapsae TaxID=34508 RepID=A0A4U8UVF4_STECR|nr:hypothetical protein L596_003116 [Steinernema carpocapsae]
MVEFPTTLPGFVRRSEKSHILESLPLSISCQLFRSRRLSIKRNRSISRRVVSVSWLICRRDLDLPSLNLDCLRLFRTRPSVARHKQLPLRFEFQRICPARPLDHSARRFSDPSAGSYALWPPWEKPVFRRLRLELPKTDARHLWRLYWSPHYRDRSLRLSQQR